MMALGFHLPSNCNAITGQKSVTPCDASHPVSLEPKWP